MGDYTENREATPGRFESVEERRERRRKEGWVYNDLLGIDYIPGKTYAVNVELPAGFFEMMKRS